jgi:hypothetical protein
VPPSVAWGLTTGLFVAIVDTALTVLPGSLGVSGDVAEIVDLAVNFVLFAILGFRVGRWGGVVRDAAEGGVIAGVVAATISVAISLLMHIEPQSGSQTIEIVRAYAQNIALGGVVAVFSGWYGTIARESGSARRP